MIWREIDGTTALSSATHPRFAAQATTLILFMRMTAMMEAWVFDGQIILLGVVHYDRRVSSR